jgi:hypothetical protein
METICVLNRWREIIRRRYSYVNFFRFIIFHLHYAATNYAGHTTVPSQDGALGTDLLFVVVSTCFISRELG